MGDITGIKTAGNYELQNVMNYGGVVTPSADQGVCYYKHFNLSDEQLGYTQRYNCWGFTFLPRRYWINSSTDVDMILQDNCTPVSPGSLRRGDIIRYRNNSGVTTHTGRVWEVDSNGNCVKVRSKWGGWPEYIHVPLDSRISGYGTNLAYFRQHTQLTGIGDLWIRDAYNDIGEQYSYSLWASPDILVDTPPYGSVDINPVFNVINRVRAVVHNRSDKDIINTKVRYYWADPHVGFAPSNWQLIPSSPGHPNPTSTFTVPGNSSIQAPYVNWIPQPVLGVANPAHQCLLAIAYVDDDPKNSSNPDPIVYPFTIRWENNIAARNVHVVKVEKEGKSNFEIGVGVPFDNVERLICKLRLRLTYIPRLPIFGFPKKIIPPRIWFSLDDKRRIGLVTKLERIPTFKRIWGPRIKPDPADYELIAPLRFRSIDYFELKEKTIAWREMSRLLVYSGKSRKLHVDINIPRKAVTGSNFFLRIEQEVKGEVTCCYTVVISIL